jgi:RNA polymerase sigma-70 factor (ECF subfamily)
MALAVPLQYKSIQQRTVDTSGVSRRAAPSVRRTSVPDVDDHDLLRAIGAGDADALVSLYDRYGRLAFGVAYRILQDASSAEEVVQDAFLRVWRQAATYDPGRGNVRGWITSIVHHRAIDLLRGKAGRQRQEVAIDDVERTLAGGDVWTQVAQTLDREQVLAAVGSLPVDQRRAVELAYFQGLTHQEIADSTGVPLGTVKSRLRLGLRKLYEAMAAGSVTDKRNATR